MFALGQAVVVPHDGAYHVGEVVGVRALSEGRLYDVSLEHIVIKAMASEDLRAVTEDELNGLLSSFVGAAGTGASERDVLLRREYVAFLARARAAFDADATTSDAVVPARFAVGEYVAVRDGASFALGRVMGVSISNHEASYVLEVMGENRRVGEDALCDLSDAPSSLGLALGARARFVADGYEDDESFFGVVCGCAEDAEGPVFSLLFDDGDVLEDLRSADLALLPDNAKV
jgi:hypothetical protein